jgi:hypothetical protein
LVEIIVTVISVNDQPVAEDEQSYMEEDSSLELDLMSLVEDAQYERKLVPGDISISEEPQNGNVTYNESDGTASYTPLENYHGSDAFNYTVCDAGNPKMCSTARITVDIESVNDEPEILEIPPSLFVNEDSSVEIPLMTYVKDAEYEPKLQNDRIAIVEEEEVLPKHGSIFYESDSGNAIYQPQKNYHGQDSFRFEVCDIDGGCNSAVVKITVVSVDDEVIARSIIIRIKEDSDSGELKLLDVVQDVDASGGVGGGSALIDGNIAQDGFLVTSLTAGCNSTAGACKDMAAPKNGILEFYESKSKCSSCIVYKPNTNYN